jgi:hypothetical protein
MILRPLCTSVDLEKAIAFAKKEYSGLVNGLRPFIHTLPYRGTTDALLCRIILGITPELDTIQIFLLSVSKTFTGSSGAIAGGAATFTTLRSQTIVTTSAWVLPMVDTDTPQYSRNNEAAVPHPVYPSTKIGEFTVVSSGGSGNPVVFSSSDPAVCSISGNDIISQGSGRVRFFADQAGGTGYLPATELVSGTHIFSTAGRFFSQGGALAGGRATMVRGKRKLWAGLGLAGGRAVFGKSKRFIGSGGAIAGGAVRTSKASQFAGGGGSIAGGAATFSSTQDRSFTGAGGVITGGSATVNRAISKRFDGLGGAIAGGSATITLGAIPKPTAVSAPVTFPYRDVNDTFISIYPLGTAVRGGVLTYQVHTTSNKLNIVEDIVNGKKRFKVYKLDHYWLGTTTFTYTATETFNGISVTSDPATVTLEATKPTAMAHVSTLIGNPNTVYTWSGGAYSFSLELTGVYSGVTLQTASVGSGTKQAIIVKAVGSTSTSGYLKITDHYGLTVPGYTGVMFIALTELGVTPAGVDALICSYTVPTTTLAVGGTTPVSSITLDPRVSNGHTMFSSNTAIARVENNALVRGMANGSCQIILKQFGITGQFLDGRHEKTFTVGPGQPTPPTPGTGGWHIVKDWSCGAWQTPYLYSPYNVTASPNGQYRLTWAVVREEYRGQSGVETTGHDPRTFATYLGVDMAFVYSYYFVGYSYSEENPESNGWIHIRYWEKFG